ncbi:MAG: extracellular solute-binding protein [Betaproteobacteria bacterium]|nr:extracellular solute-binding protein [Betaproteobacteria bacterium]
MPTFRSVAFFLSALLAAGLSTAGVCGERVIVLTSYPEEVFSRFEAAYEHAHPGVDVEVLWRTPHDALEHLSRTGNGDVDVFWAASPRTFRSLADLGLLDSRDVDRSGIPDSVGPLPLVDPSHRFHAFELASFGIVSDPAAFAALGSRVPGNWSDLTDPRLENRVGFPVPSRVGFATALVDGILQATGWREGWALIGRLGANSRLALSGGTSIVDDVRNGHTAAGVTIDFFAQAAIAKEHRLEFRHPAAAGSSLGHAAVLRSAPHRAGAVRFVSFLLSPEGQHLLAEPGIRRIAIHPAAHQGARFPLDPYQDLAAPMLRFDTDLAAARAPTVSALFDALVTRRQHALRAAWRAWEQARRDDAASSTPASMAALGEAEDLLSRLPLTAEAAGRAPLRTIFERRRSSPEAEAEAAAIESSWTAFFDENARLALERLAALRTGTGTGSKP